MLPLVMNVLTLYMTLFDAFLLERNVTCAMRVIEPVLTDTNHVNDFSLWSKENVIQKFFLVVATYIQFYYLLSIFY